jgi:hypothetical protein
VLAAEIILLRPPSLRNMFRRPATLEHPKTQRVGDRAAQERHSQREEAVRMRSGLPLQVKNVPIFAQSDLLRTVSLSARTTPNHRVVTPSHKPVQCRRCDKAWGDRLKRLLESGLVPIFNFTRSSHVHAICA